MKLINQFVNWILYTSLFAASCATGMCMATERLLLNDIPELINPLHGLVFGSTLMVYNTHALIRKAKESDLAEWSKHYRVWHMLFLTIGTGMCVASVFKVPMSIIVACGVLGLLSFAYSLPLLPIKDRRRVKDFGQLKIFALTTVWTIVTSVLPILYWGKAISDYPFEILIRFSFMFPLCVAFDIRDMQTDLENGIYTLPNILGLNKSYLIIDISLLFFIVLSVVQYMRYPSAARLGGEIATAILTWLAIRYTKKYPSDRAYLAFVDGMMLVYSLLVLWH